MEEAKQKKMARESRRLTKQGRGNEKAQTTAKPMNRKG